MNIAPGESIHERMAAILSELPAIGKSQRNEQQGFQFRGHDDVLNALNPLLAKHQVFAVPTVLDRVTAQRQTSRGSVMFEVNLLVQYTFYGPAGDWVTASAWGEGTDMGDKATNKAMTMAFKNVLNQTFAISTAETVDSDRHTPDETVHAPASSAAAPRATGGPADPHGLQQSRGDTAGPLATDAQKKLVRLLEKKLNVEPKTAVDSLTKTAASQLITELKALEEGGLVSAPGGADPMADIPFAPVNF